MVRPHSQSELQAEYEYALREGNDRIDRRKLAFSTASSIEDIHHWYCYAANILIQKGEPRHKIVGKLYEDFGQFYGERNIRYILEKNKILTDKDFLGQGGFEDKTLQDPLQLTSYEDENGNFSQNNSSDFTLRLSPNSPHWRERLNLIWMFTELERRAKVVKEILFRDYDIEYTETGKKIQVALDWDSFFAIDTEENKNFWEYMDLWKNLFANLHDEWKEATDERQKILAKEFVAYVAVSGITSLARTARNFHIFIKRTLVITSKKTTQLLRTLLEY